ncbi:MAG: pilus assembly protein PilY [Desulfuromonadaceae bacterium]|nr:pilus assembly protein PilY [Desulfuromonadaceae bacterium]MDD5105307.1 pilus assembly protein PilY [Desulfuromonadaceae bacterium]
MRNKIISIKCSTLFVILFSLLTISTSAFAWDPWFTSYYGTSNTNDYNDSAANWTGGTVYRKGNNYYQLGTAGHLENQSGSAGEKTFQVRPASGYKITQIKWCRASWTDPDSILTAPYTGYSWNTVSGLATNQTSNFDFSFNTSSDRKYLIWVVFEAYNPNAHGGQAGAWYGTNNTIGYDTPVANGSGGEVWKTDGTDVQLSNRNPDGTSLNSDGHRHIQVRPASGFKIVSIKYGETLTPSVWSDITLPDSPQTSNVSFTINMSGGNQYVISVVFASTAASSYTVTGSVDAAGSDAECTPNSVSPASSSINVNQTGTFDLTTSSNCVIDSVNFNGTGYSTNGISGVTYTTPPITNDASFTVKFRKVDYTITASVDVSSPSGSGTISPAGVTAVTQGASQAFTITANAGYIISHVYVTDADKSYNNLDIVPLSTNSYTFNNIQANGVITVHFIASVPASGNDYCQVPPFVQGQTNLTPNVLIIFDNSGSMGGTDSDGYAYYNTQTYSCTSSHNATTNPCPTIFYGYFDPLKMYKVDAGDSNVYLEDTVTLNLSTSNGKSGNYLNWRNMNKVDIVRKVLVGGRVTDKGSSTLAGANRPTLATKYLWSDKGKWVQYGTTEPKGLVQNLADRVRFGLEVFGSTSNSNSDGGTIVAKLGSPVGDLVTAIEGPNTNPKTNTPIAEALYEAIRYYQAKPSAYNSNTNYGDTTWNPDANPIIQYPCQKHFVLLLTDGEANSTDKLPGLTNPTLNSYTDSIFDVTTWVSRMVAADKPTGSDGQYVDGTAYYGHVNDMRSAALSNDMAGTQNITFYSVYAFGDGSGTKTLQSMAKYGGFESKNGDDKGTSPNQYPSPDQVSEWDKDGNNVPDTYFEATDGAVLESSISTAISSILAKVASGTAASILSNSEGSGANLLQAVFYPNKIFTPPTAADVATSANWIGEMQNLWYYVDPFIANSTVREDTDFSSTTPYHVLNLKNDYVARFFFSNSETKVELKRDTNGDGLGEALVTAAEDPDLVKSVWRAGRLLWARSANSRRIHTSIDGYSLLLPAADDMGGFYAPSLVSTRVTSLLPYLQAADATEAKKIIDYVRGTDQFAYRNRRVSLLQGGGTVTSEWKLGDIVSSTPRLQSTNRLNTYNLESPTGYADKSYAAFIASSNYKSRGMVYVGVNDGMLHAFKLGKLTVSGVTDVPKTGGYVTIGGDIKATLTGTNLGEEQWAYVPRSALPYLKYFTDAQNYKHLFYIDGPTVLADVATGIPAACTTGDYSGCARDETGGTNWKTVLIGSMGLGGASRFKSSACTADLGGTCVKTPIFDPTDAASPKTKGVGYSSYFALDITGQYFLSDGTLANQPTLKWEFPPADATGDVGLGYATSGAAIVRISATKTDPVTSVVSPDKTKNGKWFAVFASGPTGPIDTSMHRFMGRSDQNLKLFVVDLGASAPLVKDTNYWVIDTGIQRAFAGSIASAVIDSDRWNKSDEGNYQDDALYIGYTKAGIADSDPITAATEWTNGGVLRLLTKEDTNPANWTVGEVVANVGPVTSGIAKLQDRKNMKLWLYFGTGRFFYSGDDSTNNRYIMGVQDLCYTINNKINKNCTVSDAPVLGLTDLKLQNTIGAMGSEKGWRIQLDSQSASMGAERTITDPVALTNGLVLFTTFKPTADVCKFGGDSYVWGTKYDTGGAPPASTTGGKMLVQVSTGAFEEIALSSALTAMDGRKIGSAMTGKPPSDPPPVVSNASNKPPKKIMHLQEK